MLNGLEHNFLLHQRTPTSCLLPKGLSPCASRSALKRVKRSHLPLALIFLVYQEIIRLVSSTLGDLGAAIWDGIITGETIVKKSLQGEQESNFYNGFSCDYPLPTSCNWVSEDGGDEDTISLYAQKKVKKKKKRERESARGRWFQFTLFQVNRKGS